MNILFRRCNFTKPHYHSPEDKNMKFPKRQPFRNVSQSKSWSGLHVDKPSVCKGDIPEFIAVETFAVRHSYSRGLWRWVPTCNFTTYPNAVTLQVTDTIRSYDLNFHPVPHAVTVSCERYTVEYPVCYGSQKHHECKAGERSGRWWRVTLHVQTCSGRNRIIPLMRRPNTNSAPNMPVTLPRKQLLIRYVVTGPVHTVTIRCYGTW
jgi:hypothetical protein